MKELSIEQKAKAYDEALKRAKLYNSDNVKQVVKDLVTYIFPELKESEDERIRKELIDYIKSKFENSCSPTPSKNILGNWLAWLEKQGEQKYTDKVKPKFNVGDWIIFNGLTLYINEVVKGYYKTISKGGIHNSYDWDIDNAARRWTIQDAKDGDVLVNKNGCPFIFKDAKTCWCYYSISCGVFCPKSNKWFFSLEDHLCPATKEQREILSQKMKEAGYFWDTEKKELERIDPIEPDEIIEECYQDNADHIIDIITEQEKPSDKAEPKFKVGDWIINSKGTLRHIIDVDKEGYQTDEGWATHDTFEKTFHLWTIQDAKDGDVLAASDGSIFIFKEIMDYGCKHYIALEKDNETINVNDNLEHFWENARGVKPSTKEQRDLLFQKMKEASYEWNAEKKELNKIGQKSNEWSEEDEAKLKSACALIRSTSLKGNDEIIESTINWLKSLKPQPKQELSEEDERLFDKLVYHLRWSVNNGFTDIPAGPLEDWIKSLKEHITWKPTEEQMKALHDLNLTGNISYARQGQVLIELYNDLKKLI